MYKYRLYLYIKYKYKCIKKTNVYIDAQPH